MTQQNPKISFTSIRSGEEGTVNPTQGQEQVAPQRKRQVVHVPSPTVQPVPKAPVFEATGLMASPEPSFLIRNAQALGLVAILCITFLLGLSTAYLIFSGEVSEQTVAMEETAPSALMNSDVASRAATPDLTAVNAPSSEADAQHETVTNLASAVLAGLKPTSSRAQPLDELAEQAAQSMDVLATNKLRMLREGVLAGAYDIETIDVLGEKRVRLRTINADTTSSVVADTLIKAAEEGRIEMAISLRTPEGAVDTDTMVFNLVQNSLLRDKSGDTTYAAHEMSRKVFAASNAWTADIGGQRIYTVRSGDSLAYISLQFYGMPSAYLRILEANQDTLQSPDKIQVGQRLIIPS